MHFFREFLSLSKEVTQALKTASMLPGMNGESHSSTGKQSPVTATASSTNDVHMDSNSSEEMDGGGGNCGGASDVSDPSQGPSGLLQQQVAPERRTREDKSADLYRKHMKTLQFDTSAVFSLTGSQVSDWAKPPSNPRPSWLSSFLFSPIRLTPTPTSSRRRVPPAVASLSGWPRK